MAIAALDSRLAGPAAALSTIDLLRLSTAGSVDDGKSTLIGRLLYETKSIFEDQLEAIERASLRQGADQLNLALLTDGLRAEREQGITIDVAYRYFATPRRKFIIADTPGHVQYTRNMVTGASTSDLALILVDARNGVVEQSRRHALLASLLGVRQLLVCVNKMDLVGYAREAFEQVRDEFSSFATGLGTANVAFIPVSALYGDNVIEPSANMEWYDGPALLPYLEAVPAGSNAGEAGFRFPVQWVVRPMSNEHHDYRAYAGQIGSGRVQPGDEVLVLPLGKTTRIRAIDTYDGSLDSAAAPLSVSLLLEDDLDVSRGDMLCDPFSPPSSSQDVEAMVCWFSETPLNPNGRYTIRHTTRKARALVTGIDYRLDTNTLQRDTDVRGLNLKLNDVGRLRLRTTQPLLWDEYRRNRVTGSFILADEGTNSTVAAGMILPPGEDW